MSEGPSAADGPTGSDTETIDAIPELPQRYLRWAAFIALGVVIVVAGANFYLGVMQSIDVWISDRYRPVFQAVFNLGVLFVAAVGVVWLVRTSAS